MEAPRVVADRLNLRRWPYRLASNDARLLALMVDVALIAAYVYLLLLLLPPLPYLPDINATYVAVFAGPFLYFTLMEWSFRGTLGKRLFGLKVVEDDGYPLGLTRSALRAVGKLAFGILPFVGIQSLLSLFTLAATPRNQALHDLLAMTVVIRGGVQPVAPEEVEEVDDPGPAPLPPTSLDVLTDDVRR